MHGWREQEDVILVVGYEAELLSRDEILDEVALARV
jgi:hypothetical protein